MKLPKAGDVIDTALAVAVYAVMGLLLVTFTVGWDWDWDRLKETLRVLSWVFAGLLGLFAFMGLFALGQHLSERSRSAFLSFAGNTILVVFTTACAVFLIFMVWTSLTSGGPPCDVPGCRN